MTGGNTDQLQIALDKLAQALGMPPPPPIRPDQLAAGRAAISNLLRVLGMAANSGDPADIAAAETGYDERELKVGDALGKFPANEDDSSVKLSGVGNQNEMAQMMQQIPQIASGIAGGFSGAISGLLQPLTQLSQQAAQAGQQALQAGMGALEHQTGKVEEGDETFPTELTGGHSGESGGGGTGGGELGNTTPTAMLEPLPGPSAGTLPAASYTTSAIPPTPPETTKTPASGMGAMPMVPPGGMQGAAAAADNKPDTKRIVGPTVKNGAPVQGRITTPPPLPEVIRRVEGKPIASRRVLFPDYKREDDDAESNT